MISVISLLALLTGAIFFRNIRLGAAAGILIMLVSTVFQQQWLPAHSTAIADALVITLELGWLLFGAISFYEYLHDNGRLGFLQQLVSSSPGRPFLIVMCCFYLGSFFEGIAGFGVPPVLIIPLLQKAGFKPLTAICTALCGSVVAVLFGALGAPVVIGLGITQFNDTVRAFVSLNCVTIVCAPFLLVWLYARTEKAAVDWKREWKMLLGAGSIYLVVFSLSSFFTVEFPAVIAGSVGMILFVVLFNPAGKALGGGFWLSAFWPYLLFVACLLLAKWTLYQYRIDVPAASRKLSAYQPGLVFFAGICILSLLIKPVTSPIAVSLHKAVKRTSRSLPALLLLVIFSQLIRIDMADLLGRMLGSIGPAAEPPAFLLIGTAGAFITGSATMSNLLMGGLLTAVQHKTLYTAILHSGSVYGNVISLQNIVMARSAVHSPVSEGKILSYNSRFLAGCLALTSLLIFAWLCF